MKYLNRRNQPQQVNQEKASWPLNKGKKTSCKLPKYSSCRRAGLIVVEFLNCTAILRIEISRICLIHNIEDVVNNRINTMTFTRRSFLIMSSHIHYYLCSKHMDSRSVSARLAAREKAQLLLTPHRL